MGDRTSEEIRASMQLIFAKYADLRDRGEGSDTPFWDAVVLTTFDEAQRRCFEVQVEKKRESGELPKVPIYVVADPPGQKLGVGGSTLHVLCHLTEIFGSQELRQKRLLIIHSGGSSQRLPSYSVVGKIFAPVPVEGLCTTRGGVPQMLDLKLALYLPLCRLLGPGVLVTCADDIETYCLDLTSEDTEALAGADVVALGHPSSLAVGTGHGVYVLEGGEAVAARGGGGTVHECLEVLQKPSISAMRASGAAFRRGRREGGGGGGGPKGNTHQNQEEEEEEEVWSDSVFWMGPNLTTRLLDWYRKNRPLDRELDAYAHILPCLGSRLGNTGPSGGMGQEQKDLQSGVGQDFRLELTPILRGAKFRVIALPKSKFYHLGTMGEYLGNYNLARDFVFELGILRLTGRGGRGVEVCGGGGDGGDGDSGGEMLDLVRKEEEEEERKEGMRKKKKQEEEEEKKEEDKSVTQPRPAPPAPHTSLAPPHGTIIESYLTSGTQIHLAQPGIPYVIEQCHITLPLRLTGSSILSNCAILPCANLLSGTPLPLPPGTLFHTVPVRKMSRSSYVTVAFDINAKMKDFGKDLKNVRAFGRTLEDYAHVLGLSGKDVRGGSPTVSLWSARIFRSAPTAEESFLMTLKAIWKVKGGSEGCLRVRKVSKGDYQGCEGEQRVTGGCEGVGREEKEEEKRWRRKEKEEEEEEEERKRKKKLAVERGEEEEEEEEGKRNGGEKRKGEAEEDSGRTEKKKKKEEEEELYSMSDVVKFKDLEKLNEDRKKLIALIRE